MHEMRDYNNVLVGHFKVKLVNHCFPLNINLLIQLAVLVEFQNLLFELERLFFACYSFSRIRRYIY